ncbi:MAG: hypothetical protein ACRD0U_13905, partial [Acidimicrobiales bacterium]
MHAGVNTALAAAVALAALVLSASPAWAPGYEDRPRTRAADVAVGVDEASVQGAVWATQLGRGPGSSGGSYRPPGCSYVYTHPDGMNLDGLLLANPTQTFTGVVVWRPRHSGSAVSVVAGTGRWYEVACVADDARYSRVLRTVFVPARDAAEIALEAFNSGLLELPILAVAASPPLGADQLVGLETWVWVPATEWDQTVSRDLPALFTVL